MPPPVIVTRWSSSSYHGSDAVDASKRNLLAVAAHQTGVPVNLSVNSSRYIAQMSSKHALIVTFFTRWPCAENVCVSRFCLRPLFRNDNTANIPLFILLQGCKMIKTQDEPKRHAPPMFIHHIWLWLLCSPITSIVPPVRRTPVHNGNGVMVEVLLFPRVWSPSLVHVVCYSALSRNKGKNGNIDQPKQVL